MIRKFTSIAFAGALMLAAVPASAQDVGGAINGLTQAPGQILGGVGQGLGIDLDPFHIFTPAPQPMAEPGPEPMMRHHRMMRHHMRMRHNGMKYHHDRMMMHKRKMMKQKRLMKTERHYMRKDAMKK